VVARVPWRTQDREFGGFMTDHQQPAGWYPSPEPDFRGRFARYWDGERWTDHRIAIDDTPAGPGHQSTPTAPTPAPPSSDDADAGSDPVGRRHIWLLRLAIALAIAVLVPLFLIERLDATGTFGYSLRNETTGTNPLVNAPSARVTIGETTREFRLTPTGTGFSRVGGLTWSLDAPITVEFVPAFDAEEGHRFLVDLRRGGANALSDGWNVRVDVVATDSTFEVAISQPVTRGFVRSREVTQRVTLPRSNERMLIAAREAEREREAAARRAADEAQRARSECERDESASRRTEVAPITGLQTLLQGSLDRRRIYSGESMTFDEYRMRISNLTSDMRTHLNDAERALATAPQPSTGEFERHVRDYAALRQAWVDFERALRSPRTGPQQSFQELYPVESGAIERLQDAVRTSSRAASEAAIRVIALEVRGTCASRHPLP
jgi:hypothetical protein